MEMEPNRYRKPLEYASGSFCIISISTMLDILIGAHMGPKGGPSYVSLRGGLLVFDLVDVVPNRPAVDNVVATMQSERHYLGRQVTP